MDKNVDPCEDFYQFSCGGLDNKMNPIAEDRSSLSTASNIYIAIENRIKGKDKIFLMSEELM